MALQPPSDDESLWLYRNRRGELLATAEAIVGCSATAEDLVQESWIRWNSKSYDPAQAFLIVRRIVRNLAFDWRRRTKLERDFVDSVLISTAAEPDPERIHLAREGLRRADAALAELPNRTRKAFELRRVHGLSFEEVGARLGVSNQRAHQLVRNALLHLDRRLTDHEAEERA
jgi:RNA polymerase sigma factor (sigma-70 family)